MRVSDTPLKTYDLSRCNSAPLINLKQQQNSPNSPSKERQNDLKSIGKSKQSRNSVLKENNSSGQIQFLSAGKNINKKQSLRKSVIETYSASNQLNSHSEIKHSRNSLHIVQSNTSKENRLSFYEKNGDDIILKSAKKKCREIKLISQLECIVDGKTEQNLIETLKGLQVQPITEEMSEKSNPQVTDEERTIIKSLDHNQNISRLQIQKLNSEPIIQANAHESTQLTSDNQNLLTQRTQESQITLTSCLSQIDYETDEDIAAQAQANPVFQEIFELANFYQTRNLERVEQKQFNLFPFSQYACPQDEDDDEDDEDNLPTVYPPFLPPKIDEDLRQYTLVLDLDETLIHFEDSQDNEDGDNEVFYMVRPGLNKFLSELSQYYEIVIFTAALQDYADWILNSIDRKKVISHRLYRQHCKRKRHFAIKDLSLIGRDLSKCIIIDNIGENYEYTQPDNGLEIVSWYDDLDDVELEKYVSFLSEIALRQEPDVREVIKRYRDNFNSYILSQKQEFV
eukprot:403348696